MQCITILAIPFTWLGTNATGIKLKPERVAGMLFDHGYRVLAYPLDRTHEYPGLLAAKEDKELPEVRLQRLRGRCPATVVS